MIDSNNNISNMDKFNLCLKKKSKVASTSDLARIVAPKAVQFIYNFISIGPRVILRSAFQLLRANIVTRVLSALVLIAFDTVSLIRKRISLKQYIINLVLAAMLLIGGTAGWMLGHEVVAFVLLENVVIGFIAGLAGAGVLGAGLAMGWERLVSIFVKDDTQDMLDICSRVFCDMAKEYQLNDEEIERIKEHIEIDAQVLSNMFAQKDREGFARELIEGVLGEGL